MPHVECKRGRNLTFFSFSDRIISRAYGPPQSFDFRSPRFFPVDLPKRKEYENEPGTFDDLKATITREISANCAVLG